MVNKQVWSCLFPLKFAASHANSITIDSRLNNIFFSLRVFSENWPETQILLGMALSIFTNTYLLKKNKKSIWKLADSANGYKIIYLTFKKCFYCKETITKCEK